MSVVTDTTNHENEVGGVVLGWADHQGMDCRLRGNDGMPGCRLFSEE